MKSSSIAYVAAFLVALTFAGGASAEQPPNYLMNDDLVLAEVDGANAYLAYSKHTGAWKRHDFGEDVKAIPVLASSLCVFMQTGEAITQLVGVDRQGNWRTTKLHSPAKEVKPIVSDSLAYFIHDGHAYAFSPITGTWDAIRATATPILDQEMVLIKSDHSIAVFSAQTGRWAEAPASNKP